MVADWHILANVHRPYFIKVDIICNLKVAIAFWVMLKERVFN